MEPSVDAPFFSIIISTRDRPELFETALASVRVQSFGNKEIIVVVDGSSQSNLARYHQLQKQYGDISFYYLVHRLNGHGQSYAMNFGAQHSRGEYLCFLDDDDHWTDKEYLQGVAADIEAAASVGRRVDLEYSNQRATYSDGRLQTIKVWIEDLIPRVRPENHNREDSYFVDTELLLSSIGFAHLNCSVFRRKFYESLEGMDESIRYENDRDVFIRAIDAADTILYSTKYISMHNIPDVTKKSNMSTISSDIEKKLYQLHVFDKGISLSSKPSVVRFCMQCKIYELKNITTILEQRGEFASAAHYARESVIGGFNLRWFAYSIYLGFKAWRKGQDSPAP